MIAATALIQARKAQPELAIQAVRQAMQRAGLVQASTVLLFLSAEFMPILQATLEAVTIAAGTRNIFGCSAVGVMTEEDWAIDGPSVAVMIFGPTIGLATTPGAGETFTLAAPNAINTLWLNRPTPCYGGVSGDITGSGPYTVWANGELVDGGRMEARWVGLRSQWELSFGLEMLTPTLTVTEADGLDLQTVEGGPAAVPLWHALRDEDATDQLPLVYAVPENGEPVPLLSVHLHNGRVTLARALQPGARLRWAMRTAPAAVAEIQQALDNARSAPRLVVMIASAGRGPSLHGGRDAEWEAVRRRWPGVPLIGFYGNGEISHFAGANRVLTTSTLLGLFR